MPLLCLYSDFVGVIGGAVIGVGMLDLSWTTYFNETANAVSLTDILGGVFKASVYGVLIALSGCLRGLQCGNSSSAVGDAATSAVVTGIVAIVLALGIGPIKFPGYLDRPQLVTRVSQNRFAVAENDRWAEPLEENFSRVLSQNLSILLQTDRIVAYPWERSQQPAYQVQVEVLRFEPNAEQIVELWAQWSITDKTKKILSVKESYLTRPAKDKSTEASVAALSEVVGTLSQEISASIRSLSGG
jgi:uncharacterized lipoprotein YmbA